MSTATSILPTGHDDRHEAEPTSPLTERQRDIFNWMVRYTIEHFYQPSVREIGKEFEINSPNGVMEHLHGLSKKGLIDIPIRGSSYDRTQPSRARAIEFLRRIPIED